jgi:hypothetical protein
MQMINKANWIVNKHYYRQRTKIPLPPEVQQAKEEVNQCHIPQTLESIWQSPFIIRFETEDGTRKWACLHCNRTWKGHRADKAIQHVAEADVCEGSIGAEWQELYTNLHSRQGNRQEARAVKAAGEIMRVSNLNIEGEVADEAMPVSNL